MACQIQLGKVATLLRLMYCIVGLSKNHGMTPAGMKLINAILLVLWHGFTYTLQDIRIFIA